MSTETSVQQFALEFVPSKVQAELSAPPGTWTVCPRFTTAEYRAAIARAGSALPALEPFLQMLYREGVALASGALRELDETIEDEAACRYALPRLELPVNADVFRHFIALCDSEATPGAEHRTRAGIWQIPRHQDSVTRSARSPLPRHFDQRLTSKIRASAEDGTVTDFSGCEVNRFGRGGEEGLSEG